MAFVQKLTNYAPDIFKALNGVAVIYKPLGITGKKLQNILKDFVAEQLNDYEPRPLNSRVLIEGGYNEEKRISQVPDLADHPLVVGPRYVPWEVPLVLSYADLSDKTSGVVLALFGGETIKKCALRMKLARYTNVYHIKASFGYATANFFDDGPIIDRANYAHVRSGHLEAMLSRIQGSQKNRLYDAASIPLNSDLAYELAKSWPSRPSRTAHWPVIYRLRCLQFKLPHFEIEVHVCNENELYLARVIHDLGLCMKSRAHVHSIRRVRCGSFDVANSLIDKEWDLQSIVHNIDYHNRVGLMQTVNYDYLEDTKVVVEDLIEGGKKE